MNPLLAACDTFRPAAMEQLRVLGEQVGVPVYMELGATDPVAVARHAIQEAKAKAHDVLIIDTAGRQAIDEPLMQQIQDIRDAVSYGVVKMNIDTDTQWATWNGVLQYYKDKEAYLQGQLGNPEGEHAPNKKYYDPRVWLRKGQESMIARLQEAFEELGSKNSL